MPLTTLSELRTNIGKTVRETQINDLIDSFINLTGLEIHDAHRWTYLRRKQTFQTVADQEDYNLDSEVGRISLIREINSPRKIHYVPDHLFYRLVPAPENTGSGTSKYYRRWEETGFSTNLAADDTIYVKSDSTSDGSSFNVRVTGRNSSGEPITETITLNGTTNVTSSTTFQSAGLLSVAKSAATTGTVTVYRTTGDTVLSEMEPDNLAPRYKRISLYPVPSSAITIYYEYYERYRYLVHDTDVPQMDTKWNWVLREGALSKAWEYKQNETAFVQHLSVFNKGLDVMKAQDSSNEDYVPVMQPRSMEISVIHKDNDSVSNSFPTYSLNLY